MAFILKTIFSFCVLIAASLTQITVLAINPNTGLWANYHYSLLYLAAFLLSIIFKNNYACIAAIFFLFAGIIGLPIFAFGGGFAYIFEPSFVYLLGLVMLCAISFYQEFHSEKFLFNGINFGPLLGICAAHILALLLLALTARLNLDNLFALSLYQFIYDLFFALISLTTLAMLSKPKP